MEERRTIKIKEKTYKKLRAKGMMGETFDDLLNRLMFEERIKAKEASNKIAPKIWGLIWWKGIKHDIVKSVIWHNHG